MRKPFDNHERIWLEPMEPVDNFEGRRWCRDNVWGDDAVEYIRADLVATPSPLPHLAAAAREFMSATEALLDWMNNTELAADHKKQQPEDFERLCTTMVALRAALAATEGKDNG